MSDEDVSTFELEDPQDFDDYGPELGTSIAASRFSQEREYDAETLAHLNQMKHPINQQNLVEIIENTTLLARCKRAHINIVNTYFNQDTLLANIENIPQALNDLRISLSEVIPHATKYDTHNPDWLQVRSLIQNTYEIILTRTRGPKRERIMQDTSRVEVMTGKYGTAKTTAAPSRGLPSLFGGKRNV